jgi:hypothetical protein
LLPVLQEKLLSEKEGFVHNKNDTIKQRMAIQHYASTEIQTGGMLQAHTQMLVDGKRQYTWWVLHWRPHQQATPRYVSPRSIGVHYDSIA